MKNICSGTVVAKKTSEQSDLIAFEMDFRQDGFYGAIARPEAIKNSEDIVKYNTEKLGTPQNIDPQQCEINALTGAVEIRMLTEASPALAWCLEVSRKYALTATYMFEEPVVDYAGLVIYTNGEITSEFTAPCNSVAYIHLFGKQKHFDLFIDRAVEKSTAEQLKGYNFPGDPEKPEDIRSFLSKLDPSKFVDYVAQLPKENV